MNLSNVLSMLVTIVLFAGFAHAGNEGGGGGGFCVNNKCFTLAEAGFNGGAPSNTTTPILIPSPPISKATYEEYSKITDILLEAGAHFIDVIRVNDYAFLSSFVKVETYNSDVMGKIKQEYIDILKEQNFSTLNFVLFAISNSEKTFLLPEFYRLDIRSQALILIHELLMRKYLWNAEQGIVDINYKDALKIILGLDATYLEILKGNKSIEWKTLYPASRLFYGGNVVGIRNAQVHLLSEVIKANGALKVPVPLERYLDPNNTTTFYPGGSFRNVEFFGKLRDHFPILFQIMTMDGADTVRMGVFEPDVDLIKSTDELCVRLSNGTYIARELEDTKISISPILVTCKNKKRVSDLSSITLDTF